MTPRPRCCGALLRDPAKSWAQTDPCGPCGPKGLEEVITGEELRLTEPNGSRRIPRDEPCDMGPWPRARLITPGGGRTPASSTPQERSFGVPILKNRYCRMLCSYTKPHKLVHLVARCATGFGQSRDVVPSQWSSCCSCLSSHSRRSGPLRGSRWDVPRHIAPSSVWGQQFDQRHGAR